MKEERLYIDDPLPFGKLKGKRVVEITLDRDLNYLKWMLSQPDLEHVWGPTIRKHLDDKSIKYDTGDSKDVHIGASVIDRFSILFADRWFNAVAEAGDRTPPGFYSYMVSLFCTAYFPFRNQKGGPEEYLIYGLDVPRRNYLVAREGVVWFFHDAGPSVTILNIFDDSDLPAVVAPEQGIFPDSWILNWKLPRS